MADWLNNNGHDVISVYDEIRGITDKKVLSISLHEQRVLITNDKDFGEMIFREQKKHCGVIFLRLDDERTKVKIEVIEKVLMKYINEIKDNFIVASEHNIRIVHTNSNPDT